MSGPVTESRGVDLLPRVLWRSGNLIMTPAGDLHFCTGPSTDDTPVRTVEWNGREVLRGTQPVDHSQLEGAGMVLFLDGRRARWALAALVGAAVLVLLRRARHRPGR